jgi:hypothetical protein
MEVYPRDEILYEKADNESLERNVQYCGAGLIECCQGSRV